jgi:ribosome recycling factor
MESSTFQRVLEIIEALTEEERESLIQIVNKRLIEERRDRLAQSIKEAREEFSRGEFAKGTVDDLMGELSK